LRWLCGTIWFNWPSIQLWYTGMENLLWATCLENKVGADYLWSTRGPSLNLFRSLATIFFNDLLVNPIKTWSSRMYPILNWPKECAVYISKSKHNSSQMVIKFPRVNTDEFDSRLLRLFMIRYQFKNLFLASTRSFIKCHSSLGRIKVRDPTMNSLFRIGHVLSVCLQPFRFEDPWSKWNWYWLDFWYNCR